MLAYRQAETSFHDLYGRSPCTSASPTLEGFILFAGVWSTLEPAAAPNMGRAALFL